MNESTNKTIEYVVGIDLGHGETSAAFCPIQWDEDVKNLDSVTDIELGHNKKVIPSALSILDNGKCYIGESAFDAEIMRQAKVNIGFKQEPHDLDGEKEKLMICYMRELYLLILKNTVGSLREGNHLVYIATPSGWSKESQHLYVQMARKAGVPISDNGVTKESRAAFVHAQHDMASGLGRSIHQGAIVFDMGSSTLDFTYMHRDLPGLIDHGYDCGASYIEKALLNDKLQHDDRAILFENRHPQMRDRLLFEARKIKEQVYFDPTLKVKKSLNYDEIVDDPELEDERFRLNFNPGELNAFLEKSGYVSQIEKAMEDFRDNYIAGWPIFGVYLTGGASRMDFIRPLVQKVWHIDNERICRDNDPSLTISQGVAEVARMDLRTASAYSGLEEEITRLQHDDTIYDSFIELFTEDMEETVCDAIVDAFVGFRDLEGTANLFSLNNSIASNVHDAFESASDSVYDIIDRAVHENTESILKRVRAINEHYSDHDQPDSEIAIPSIKELDINRLDLSGVIESIARQVSYDDTSIASSVGTVGIVGGLVLLLAANPLGWLIAAGGVLGKILGNKNLTDEEKQEKASKTPLNKGERQRIFNEFEKNWITQQKSIRSSVSELLKTNQDLKMAVNNSVATLLERYQSEQREARILID